MDNEGLNARNATTPDGHLPVEPDARESDIGKTTGSKPESALGTQNDSDDEITAIPVNEQPAIGLQDEDGTVSGSEEPDLPPLYHEAGSDTQLDETRMMPAPANRPDENIACAVADEPTVESPSKPKGSKKLAVGIGVAAVAVVIAIACFFSFIQPQMRYDEANQLFGDKEYAQALEIYGGLDTSRFPEATEKMKTCRAKLFVNWLRSNPYSTRKNNGDIDIKAAATGVITGAYDLSYSNDTSKGSVQFYLDITPGDTTADITGDFAMSNYTLIGGSVTFKASGKLDLAEYKKNEQLVWESNDRVSGYGLLGGNSTLLAQEKEILESNGKPYGAIVEALQEALDKSETGCTMTDLGFENLNQTT